jgi:membrane-bound inhibitor of C-type lysozyme
MRMFLLAAGIALALAAPANAQPSKVTGEKRYGCADGVLFRIAFQSNPDAALIAFGDGKSVLMRAAPSGSGFRYARDGFEIHGKGQEALLTRPGAAETRCVVVAETRLNAPPPPPKKKAKS